MIGTTRPSRYRRSILAVRRLEDRTVPSSVQGTVFNDANHNQTFDPGESGLAGWTVYADNNQNSIIDPGEATAVTGANGEYSIETMVFQNGVGIDLQVGSGGRWINDTPTVANSTALRNFGVHFQPYTTVQPDGPETLINSSTTSNQFFPDVAANAAGDYVVAWCTEVSGNPVTVRVFNADGTPRSGELAVTASSNSLLHVAMADNGRFVVAWDVNNANGTRSVMARAYNANATPATGAINVSAGVKNGENWIGDVAMDSAGNFAVLFESNGSHGPQPEDHLVQRYTAAGTAIGKAVTITSSSVGHVYRHSIAMDATGRFVVAWDQGAGNGTSVFAQRFSSTAQKIGSQITVSTSPSSAPSFQSNVSMNNAGRFAVTWGEYGTGLQKAQVYDWGTPVGGNITLGSSASAGSAVDAAGNVTFAWAAGDSHSSATEVRFRRLTGGGVLEPESIVNTTTQGQQGWPPGNFQSIPVGLAATGNDHFVVVWQGRGPGDDQGIFAQRFAPTAALRSSNAGTSAEALELPPVKTSFAFPAMQIDSRDDAIDGDFADTLPHSWGIRIDA